MVDPNRRINRLNDNDVAFLQECNKAFENRYTENDQDYLEAVNRPELEPPLQPNWGHINAPRGKPDGNRWRNNYGNRGGRGDRRRHDNEYGNNRNMDYNWRGQRRDNYRGNHRYNNSRSPGGNHYRDRRDNHNYDRNKRDENNYNNLEENYAPETNRNQYIEVSPNYSNFRAASETTDNAEQNYVTREDNNAENKSRGDISKSYYNFVAASQNDE